MQNGTVESIYIASTAQGTPESVGWATAIPGAGLEGDRYTLKLGTFYKPKPDRELTLIEAEAIEALRRDYQVEMAAGDARRNIVTRNVPPSRLVGKELVIGVVRIRGIRLCEPCDHLEKVTGKPVIKGLLHCGLRFLRQARSASGMEFGSRRDAACRVFAVDGRPLKGRLISKNLRYR